MKSKALKIIFFGTPWFAAEILKHLIDEKIEIVALVTQPDRPKGRSLQKLPSPVKEVAQAQLPTIPVFQPEKSSNAEFLENLKALKADLYVVVAFGQILPQKLLSIPPKGCINVHASLLPKYRGAAPIQRCILNGDKQTGISIQKMVKELDAGDVIAENQLEIPEEMTYGELEKALCASAKPLLLHVIDLYREKIPEAKAQNPNEVTYAHKIDPNEGEIHWEVPAEKIYNQIRAFNPKPGCWTFYENGTEKKRLKIFKAKKIDLSGTPGEMLSKKDLIVACGDKALQLIEVQPEGKGRMNGSDWMRGLKNPLSNFF